MLTRIQLRRDNFINWWTNNPILAAGEYGIIMSADYKTDDNVSTAKVIGYVIGNGATGFRGLPFMQAHRAVTNVLIEDISGISFEAYQKDGNSIKAVTISSPSQLANSNIIAFPTTPYMGSGSGSGSGGGKDYFSALYIVDAEQYASAGSASTYDSNGGYVAKIYASSSSLVVQPDKSCSNLNIGSYRVTMSEATVPNLSATNISVNGSAKISDISITGRSIIISTRGFIKTYIDPSGVNLGEYGFSSSGLRVANNIYINSALFSTSNNGDISLNTNLCVPSISATYASLRNATLTSASITGDATVGGNASVANSLSVVKGISVASATFSSMSANKIHVTSNNLTATLSLYDKGLEIKGVTSVKASQFWEL